MKVLITGAWNYSNDDIDFLKSIGYECLFLKDERQIPTEQMLEAEVVVCNNLFLHSDVNLFKKLKLVQLTSAGLDRVPVDYFAEKGIKIFNASGVYSIPIAEYVIGSVLDFYKHSFKIYENKKRSVWLKNRDLLELNRKTICIVGCGSVGRECAKRFKAFDCTLVGVDIANFKCDWFDSIVDIKGITNVLPDSDVVVLTLPLNSETNHLFNRDLLSYMKKDSLLVNVARGPIVKTDDLLEIIQNGKISGAILDVFETEPLPHDSSLWKLENVIISPHNSFVGDGNAFRLSALIRKNLSQEYENINNLPKE